MANQRAPLAFHDLAASHVDLGGPGDSGGLEVPLPRSVLPAPTPRAVADLFPAMAACQKERSVGFSLRLPVSLVERLDQLKRERGIVPSELVRDFIVHGLGQIEAQEKAG